MIAAHVARSFARQTAMATIGAELTFADAGVCRIEVPARPDAMAQQHGFAHAGLSFMLGDSAAGYAALSTMPATADVLTVEMKINLLAPARGTRLVAEGRVLRAGRRLIVVAAEVAADGTAVAVLQGTMIAA